MITIMMKRREINQKIRALADQAESIEKEITGLKDQLSRNIKEEIANGEYILTLEDNSVYWLIKISGIDAKIEKAEIKDFSSFKKAYLSFDGENLYTVWAMGEYYDGDYYLNVLSKRKLSRDAVYYLGSLVTRDRFDEMVKGKEAAFTEGHKNDINFRK